MNSTNYNLEIIEENGVREVFFSNESDDFVEVIFSIDGLDARTLEKVEEGTKGYCYPPHYRKGISKAKNGTLLPLTPTSEVVAMIYQGEGELRDSSLETPTFIRRRLGGKAAFHRTSQVPMVLSIEV